MECQCQRGGYGRSPGTYGQFSGPLDTLFSTISSSVGLSAATQRRGYSYKAGSGGYAYRQYLNGNIEIVKSRGKMLPSPIMVKADPQNQQWLAITREIGPVPGWKAWFDRNPGAGRQGSATSARGEPQKRGGNFFNTLTSLTSLATSFFPPQGVAASQPVQPTVSQAPMAPPMTAEAAPLVEDTAEEEKSSPLGVYLLWGGVGVAALAVAFLALRSSGGSGAEGPRARR